MATIEHVFAKDLQIGDVLTEPQMEVYTGAPGGAFVEHTRVVAVEHEYLRGRALGVVRDPLGPARDPKEVLYAMFPDADEINEDDLAPALAAIARIERWVPAAKPEHEIPQVRVTTRRFGEGPPEREVHEDGAQLNSEQVVTLRWSAVVAVVRGDVADLTESS